VAAKGSAWKIYEERKSFTFSHGTTSYSLTLVVGDVSRPISILTFNK
jgi:hypothetical protein